MNDLIVYFCIGFVIGHFLFLLFLCLYDILLTNDEFKSFIEFLGKKL